MFSYKNVVLLGYFKKKEVQSKIYSTMGQNKKSQRKAAKEKREEENAKKVMRNLIIGLVVIAILLIGISQLI